MSYLKAMTRQSSHYFIAYVLSMAAGLISFPIYTRLFSVSEYGYLSLIATMVFFVMAIGKLGIQNSIIRFYEEVKNNKNKISLPSYYSTLFFGPLLIVGLSSLLYFVVILILKKYVLEPSVVGYFYLSAIWAFFLSFNAILKNFLRAEQNTKLYNSLGVVSKYASILIGVSLVYFVFKNLTGLYVALIFTEFIVFLYLVFRLCRREQIALRHFHKQFFGESLLYGLPFTGAELTSIILNAGDRFIILYLMNSAAVGFYSAGYDLAMNAMEGLTAPLSFAITPIFMKIWAEKGVQETKVFLQKCLRFFLMIALPCIFAFNYLSKDLIILLASRKYEASYPVIPYVSFGVLLFGLTNIFTAGLIIHKKSHILAFATIFAGIINIILNFLFIPKYGFVGAALATLLAYLLLFVILVKSSFSYLSFPVNFGEIGKYLFFSIIMIGFMHLFSSHNVFFRIFGKFWIGFVVYGALLLSFDLEARGLIRQFMLKRRLKWGLA